MTCCTTLIGDYWSGPRRSRYLGLQTLVAALSATRVPGRRRNPGRRGLAHPVLALHGRAAARRADGELLWQPAGHTAGAALHRHLEPMPWRLLLAPCLVTLFGGIVFYALIVELSFVLTGVGVTSTATIGGSAR